LESAGSQTQQPAGEDRSDEPAIRPGAVRLRVGDLDRERTFYERAIGLRTLGDADGATQLGVDGTTVVELVSIPSASPRPPRSTGLFHLAILVPDRPALAQSLARLAGAGWPLTGASDHLVSEALYLNDPEGNGIEIYRDRPRSEWRYDGGSLQMSTLPLDLDGLLAELPGTESQEPGMSAGTRIGHVHLNVADLEEAESFYAGLLGFDVTVRGYPGALFLSTGGYHHHLGVNTWAGPGGPAPPEKSRGLAWFELVLDQVRAFDEVRAHLQRAGVDVDAAPSGLRTRDPSGNGVLIRCARR
jgi:catechol 2,3-dioxygenase